MLPYFIDRKAQELCKKNVGLSKHKERDLQDLDLEIFNYKCAILKETHCSDDVRQL